MRFIRRCTRLRFTTWPTSPKDLHHHARAVLGVGQVEPVDDLHQGQVLAVSLAALVVVGRAREREESALVRDG